MKRLVLSRAVATLFVAVVVAACGAEPTPSGPGAASLDVAGRRGDCHSIGGCAFVARLDGPHGQSEAAFESVRGRSDLALGPGFPPVLPDGDYRLTFELRLMSDAIFNVGPRDFYTNATCTAAFTVGPGRSVVNVRVTFGADSCSISLA